MIFLISFSIQSSIFYLFVFLILSLGLSYFLYKESDLLSDLPTPLRYILFSLRFFSFFLLFLLLLGPEFKKKDKIIDEPIIVLLQDNTESILSNKDSLFYRNDYVNFLSSLQEIQDINLKIVPFSEDIQQGPIDFSGNTTNFSSTLNQLHNYYSNMNIAAYVLISDGIYNEGLNPLYLDLTLNAPLHTVVLGDTIQHKDALIQSVRSNQIAYLGNETPVELVVEAKEMINEKILLEVFHHNEDSLNMYPIYRQNINISNNNYIDKLQFLISPKKPGIQTYRVNLKSSVQESNFNNNSDFFYIDIIDDREKILLLFSSPHPDIAAIKAGLESHDQYDVDAQWALKNQNKSMVKPQNTDYSLIISHQLSTEYEIDILNDYKDTPIWYIVGAQSDLNKFNKTQNFVKFENIDTDFEFSNVSLNPNFSSFLINDELSDFLSLSTPFLTPFSDLSIKYLSDVLLYKKIGSLNTQKPILFFVDSDYRAAFLIGEGMWRWRLNDTYLNQNNIIFNSFISKITQNLLIDKDKTRFHVMVNPIQRSGEGVIFEAELYNQNFEITNEPDVELQLFNRLGESETYILDAINDKYYLSLDLQDGQYQFNLTTKLGAEKFVKKGDVMVTDFNLEKRDLLANNSLMNDLAIIHGGQMVSKDSLMPLINSISKSSDFKPTAYFNYEFKSLINFQSLLILILCTLCLEWFLRRKYINY